MSKKYVLEDLHGHRSKESCWVAIHGKVYDVTQFLDEHPGGGDIVLEIAGDDVTEDFDEIGHSDNAKALLEKYEIGELDGSVSNTNESKKNSSIKPPESKGISKLFLTLIPILLIAIVLALMMKSDRASIKDEI